MPILRQYFSSCPIRLVLKGDLQFEAEHRKRNQKRILNPLKVRQAPLPFLYESSPELGSISSRIETPHQEDKQPDSQNG